MALIKCNECGVDVSEQAAACPKCGNPIRGSISGAVPAVLPNSRSSTKRTLVGIALGLFIAVIAVAIFAGWLSGNTKAVNGASVSEASDTTPVAQAATPEPPGPPPVIQITAQQLYAEYDANEVLADTKYKGQWLDVSGVVTEIGKDFTDDPFVNLLGKNEYAVVHAMFPKAANSKLAALHKGDQVSLMCLGKGKIVGDAVLDCSNDDTPPWPQQGKTANASVTPSPAPAALDAETSAMPTPGASEAASTTAPAAYTTSFDCSKARSDAEHLICSDGELAADDVDLAAIYAKARAVATDQTAFKEHVRQQWNLRERSCHDRGCVAQWYADQKLWFTNIVNDQAGSVSQPQASQPPSAPTYQTSFDCSAPRFLDEQAICHDRGLAAMDLEMAHDYAAAVQRGSPDKLADSQHDWIAQRRDCAGDLNCLRHAYGVRIDQIQRWQG